MIDITKRVKIDVSAARVWEVLADFGNVKPWGPTIIESYIAEKANKKQRVGTTRVLKYSSKKETEEVVTAWQERKGFTVEFPRSGGAIKSYRQVWALEGNKNEGIVTVNLRSETKWSFIGRFLEIVMFKKHFSRELTLALAGLKHYAETGEEIDSKETKLPIRSVEFKR
ncbi:MAG: SRPBCC family protein [Proteobacteria bacterium]|nr:SRPBCC family protein [Pseudomonadota bacterium]